MAFLASSLSPQTIHSYISAVRHLHISYGFSDPSLSSFVHLSYVLKGIKRVSQPLMRRHRLPITPTILRALHSVWSRHPDRDKVMLWAACCLAFFGFLRAGEFTCPSLSAFSPGMLSCEDVAVDSYANPSVMTVTLKHSKTDPFGAGVTIFLGKTGDILCPVSAMLGYLATATSTSFRFQDGRSLSRSIFVDQVREALTAVGISTAGYSGHIEAATTAAAAGLSESLIKTLGRWRSSAYMTYIRTPTSTLIGASQFLLH